MTPVFSDPDSTRVGFAKNILEAAGIGCFIQNENTCALGTNFFGLSPTPSNDPLLCVVDETRAEEAAVLLHEHFGAAGNASEWLCQECKESNPAAFEVCWKCQAVKNDQDHEQVRSHSAGSPASGPQPCGNGEGEKAGDAGGVS